MTDVLYLSGDELGDLAEPADFVAAVREAYRERGEGAPAKPRTMLRSPETPGMFTSYTAILPETGYMGGYMYAAGFAGRDAWFLTPLFDAEEGELRAILDGASFNPLKTGAASAVAVDALARDDATTLGVIGAGTQARGQLRTVATVRDFEEVLIYSPTQEHREGLAEELDDELAPPVVAAGDAEPLVRTADVVITATTASEPVLEADWLEPGTHVTAMGQYDPDKRELDADTIARATYVPDLRERAFQDAGSFLYALETGAIDEDHIHAELGEVVAGNAPGRTSDDEITVFDSGGTGIETVAAAGVLYERAEADGQGTTIDLLPASQSF